VTSRHRTRRPALLTGALSLAAAALAVAPVPARGESVRLHVRVETQGTAGEQTTRFWAFVTRDEADAERVRVSRLCVTGIGHERQERCASDVDTVEVVERVTGLPGAGSRCVEAQATAVWQTTPLHATARACP
jgi:hypothetical protein